MTNDIPYSMHLKYENPDFPKQEEDVLKWWIDNDVFNKTLNASKDKPAFSFFDGPPFATGLPHYGHILTGSIKDAVCRYHHQTGKHVERRFGWDCHGLPIEFEIDKLLDIKSRNDVLEMGIGKYNDTCRGIVDRYAGEWEHIVNRFGRWVDFKNDYKTMDLSFMESVWWVMAELMKKGLVYRAFRVMPVSTACGTPLSNFEVTQNYKDVSDPSVIIKFRIKGFEKRSLLIWTTTPWTLPSNMAVCVNRSIVYTIIEVDVEGNCTEEWVVAKSQLAWLKDQCAKHRKGLFNGFRVVIELDGSALVGDVYEPPFQYFKDKSEFKVVADDYVTDSSGSGLVHMAPGFGIDDLRVCIINNIVDRNGDRLVLPVSMDGLFTSEVPDYAGQHVKSVDRLIIAKLKESGALVVSSTEMHSYPHCWRSDTPIINMAIPSWFVKVESVQDDLVKSNDDVTWMPQSVGQRRFHNWLSEANDWCISRNRFWGTPLPIWVSSDFQEIVCIGSVAELQQYTSEPIIDLHRHHIDHIEIPSKLGKGMLKRVDEVFDCWFESGAMPFAQQHYPFENEKKFDTTFPADFICEGLDQTRGWFYTLTVLSTHLKGCSPMKNVIVNGLVLAQDGKKMSKRLNNYPDPMELVAKHGADSIRMYLIMSQLTRSEPLNFNENGVVACTREVLIPWYSSLKFLVAEVQRYEKTAKQTFKTAMSETKLSTFNDLQIIDHYILNECNVLLDCIHSEMQSYNLSNLKRPIINFLDKLTNVYIRFNRDRMRETSTAITPLSILFNVLLCFTISMAPFMPFISETIYQVLKPSTLLTELTVHMVQIPATILTSYTINPLLANSMSGLVKVIEIGRLIRDEANVSLKQSIKSCKVSCDAIDELIPLKNYILTQLNVDTLTFVELSSMKCKYIAKLNLKTLGPKYGKNLIIIKRFFESNMVTQAQLRYMTKGVPVKITPDLVITADGVDVSIEKVVIVEPDTVTIKRKYIDGVLLEMDLTIDNEMRDRATIRELSSFIQNLRKDSLLKATDPIKCYLWSQTPDSVTILNTYSHFLAELLRCNVIIENHNGRRHHERIFNGRGHIVEIIIERL